MQAAGLQLYLKRDSGTGVFLWNLQNFWEHIFSRTPLVAATEIIISWACLQGSGLLILSKSLFKLIAKRLSSVTTQSNEASSAKSLGLDARFSDKSLM